MTRFLQLAIVALFHLLVCTQTLSGQQALTSDPYPVRTVLIISAISKPPPLAVHCISGSGEDRGWHQLVEGEIYYFDFTPSDYPTMPTYTCRFISGPKRKVLVLYDEKLAPSCLHNNKYSCFWFVKEEGFYFGNDGRHYLFETSWA